MAGETIRVYGTTVNMVTSGANLTTNDFNLSNDIAADYSGSHDLCDVVLNLTFVGSVAIGQYLHLHRRDMNIEGAFDETQPGLTYAPRRVGSILLPNLSSARLAFNAVPLAPDCQFWLENQSGKTISAGWTMIVKPYGFGVAP